MFVKASTKRDLTPVRRSRLVVNWMTAPQWYQAKDLRVTRTSLLITPPYATAEVCVYFFACACVQVAIHLFLNIVHDSSGLHLVTRLEWTLNLKANC